MKQSAMPKRLNGSQKGFTLVELTVVIALAGIIGAAIIMSTHHVIRGTTLSNDRNTAVNQVSNACHWISRDVQMAQTVDDNPGGATLLELTWVEWAGTPRTVDYVLQVGELWRHYGGQQTLIAQYIRPKGAGTDCQWDDLEKVLNVNITAEVSGKTEVRTFQVKPRPD